VWEGRRKKLEKTQRRRVEKEHLPSRKVSVLQSHWISTANSNRLLDKTNQEERGVWAGERSLNAQSCRDRRTARDTDSSGGKTIRKRKPAQKRMEGKGSRGEILSVLLNPRGE